MPSFRPPVLLFPQVARRTRLSRHWCTPEFVAEALDCLREEGVVFLPAAGALPRFEGESVSPGLVLGFEVADEGFARWIWPTLGPLGIPATLFIDTAHVGQRRRNGPFGRNDSLRLSWSELRALRDDGVELASRGHHDVDHAALPEEVAFGDLVRSRREMERRLGFEPEGLLYPGRRTTASLREVVARVGFRWAVRRGGDAAPEDAFDIGALGISRWDRPALVRRRLRARAGGGSNGSREAEAG